MEECVLEKIADVMVSFTNRSWEDGAICIPDNFEKMTYSERDEYRQMVYDKLAQMLKNPYETLFSWSWNKKYFCLSFEDWLCEEINFKEVDFGNTTILERIVNKVNKRKDKKQGLKLVK